MTLIAIPPVHAATVIRSDVPFAFHLGSKLLPAGYYEFHVERESSTVTAIGPHGSDAIAILTILGAPSHPTEAGGHSHLVFDKAGDSYTLSELWTPGEEGLLVHVTKGKHEHQVVHARQ